MEVNVKLSKIQLEDVIVKFLAEDSADDKLKAILEIVFSAILKAEQHAHTQFHQDVANGSRFTRITLPGRTITLRVPRTRYTEFKPLLLAILRETQEEIEELAALLYRLGLSTDQISEVLAVSHGLDVCKKTVGNYTQPERDAMTAWRERKLQPFYPVLYLDALFIPVKRNSQVENEAFYVIVALCPDARREVLLIENRPSESATGWGQMFEQLRSRGFESTNLVVADGLSGLETKVPGALQRCVVHLMRVLLNRVRKEDRLSLKEDLQTVFNWHLWDDTVELAQARWLAVSLAWQGRGDPFFRQYDSKLGYFLQYLSYPGPVCGMLVSTNWVERLHREFRRVVSSRGSFQSVELALFLLSSVAFHCRAYSRLPQFDSSPLLLKPKNTD